MLSQLPLQEVGLWEAWIEYDQLHPTQFGTLYVLGEILTGNASGTIVSKAINMENRELRLHVSGITGSRNRLKEVLYSEPVANLDQYTSVSIYANQELIAFIDEIEVLI